MAQTLVHAPQDQPRPEEMGMRRIATLGKNSKVDHAEQKKVGIEVVRSLEQDEVTLLKESWEASKHLAVPKDLTKELYWLNYFVDGEFVLDAKTFPHQQQFHDWVVKNLNEIYYDWPEFHIVSYGFIISPAHGTVDQRFHYDYTATSSNLFVPITRVTPLNATQFLTEPLKAEYEDIQWLGDAEDLMNREGHPITIHQCIVPPFTLLRLRPSTPHRGIANRDNYSRILFFCTIDTAHYKVGEKAYSTKNDAF